MAIGWWGFALPGLLAATTARVTSVVNSHAKSSGPCADSTPPELVLGPKVTSVPQARVKEDHVTNRGVEYQRWKVRGDAIEGPWRVAVGARASVQRVVVLAVVLLRGSKVHR